MSSSNTLPQISSSSTDYLVPTSPKGFRDSIYKFLQPEFVSQSPNRKKDVQFIPYVQERDYLGNLLSKRNRLTVTSTPKDPKKASKFKSFDANHMIVQDQDIHFDGFKYQPKIPISPLKASLQKITRNSHQSQGSHLSYAFMTKGRPDVVIDRAPCVGTYAVSDKLLHPSVPEVNFSKQLKPSTLPLKQSVPSTFEEEVDIVKSFNKVYQKTTGIPDFTKQTDRNNHFLNRYHSHNDLKSNKHEVFSNKESYVVAKKDNTNDLGIRINTHQMSPQNMPMSMATLNDKFGEIK